MRKMWALLLALCLLPGAATGLTLTEFTPRSRMEITLADGVTYSQLDLTPTSRSAGMSPSGRLRSRKASGRRTSCSGRRSR